MNNQLVCVCVFVRLSVCVCVCIVHVLRERKSLRVCMFSRGERAQEHLRESERWERERDEHIEGRVCLLSYSLFLFGLIHG